MRREAVRKRNEWGTKGEEIKQSQGVGRVL